MNSLHLPARQNIFYYTFLLLLLIYLANCFTPLRLTFDTIRYIEIKEWIDAGRPAGAAAASDFLPHGYVWFLYLLGKAGICVSPVICLLQLIYFIGGCLLLSASHHYKHFLARMMVIAMLNWTTLKFIITPLSELQFFFMSCASLFFFYQWEKNKRPWNIILCLLFAVLAVMTRTAGISLVISFVMYLLISKRQLLRKSITEHKIYILVIVLAVLILPLFAHMLHIGDYLGYLSGNFQYGIVRTIINNIWLHSIDFASLFLNLPSAKIPYLPPVIVNVLFFAAGIFFAGLLVYLLMMRRNNTPLIFRIYLVVYLAMIFNWPYYEPRFFVPVLPLIIMLITDNYQRLHPLLKKLLPIYFVIYVLTGLAVLTYYSFTSINREALARKQDAGIWRNEYETLFYEKPVSDTATVVRMPVVRLLKKYNR